jgi:O-antigen ligase
VTPTLTIAASPPIESRSAPAPGCVWIWIWALTLLSINPRGREEISGVGELDLIAIAKLAVRLGGLVALGYLLAAYWNQRDRRQAAWLLAPLGVYLLWAFASVAWSPLKSISLGQALSLTTLWLLSAAVVVVDRGELTSRQLLQHTTWATSAFSLLMLGEMLFSGGIDLREDYSLAHPTTIGGTASLACVLLVACAVLWQMAWARWLLVPGLALNCAVMLLAYNRTAMLSAAAVVVVLILAYADRLLLATAGFAASIGLLLTAVIDPSWQWLLDGVQAGREFIARDQSADQLAAFSGREEMWTLMWESFFKSPWIGHGYFVSSSEGIVTVWGRDANFNAHNMLLQSLVSTGVVGAAIFLWALARPLLFAVSRLTHSDEAARRGGLFLIVTIWLAVWGLCDVALLGPVAPFVIVFFVVLGLLCGASGSEPRIQRGLAT